MSGWIDAIVNFEFTAIHTLSFVLTVLAAFTLFLLKYTIRLHNHKESVIDDRINKAHSKNKENMEMINALRERIVRNEKQISNLETENSSLKHLFNSRIDGLISLYNQQHESLKTINSQHYDALHKMMPDKIALAVQKAVK